MPTLLTVYITPRSFSFQDVFFVKAREGFVSSFCFFESDKLSTSIFATFAIDISRPHLLLWPTFQ